MSKRNFPYSLLLPKLRQCIPLQGYFEAVINRWKNDNKWRFNYWNYTLSRKFIDVKMMNIHQKTMFFFRKNDERILQGGNFITMKPMKTLKTY